MLAGNLYASEAPRVKTSGKINVYRNGMLSQVLREDAPLPTGAVLIPEGNCGVKLENILLVAKDGSEFGVNKSDTPVQLTVNKGVLYFAVNPSSGQMIFDTPAGAVTTQQFLIHSSSEGVLKGFVEVKEDATTMGVIEGGTMVVSTPQGEETIASGNQIVLAAAGASSGTAPPVKQSLLTKKTIVNSSLIAGYAAAATVLGVNAMSNDDAPPAPASPSAP